jgi:pyruvate carboxylase subunit B
VKHIDCLVTGFRDGFQSFYGARVLTADFLPAFEAAVQAGLSKLEVGGGARFQSLFFYCNENAFDMMDTLRASAGPDADFQTLARGINVVGLDSQPRDIIDLHARLFKKHGITTIRNFDALNDVNNLIYSGQCIHDAGLNHEVSVTMMGLPPGLSGAHDPEFYIGVLRRILDAGIPYSSVCFKDASGTSTPAKVHETIRQARALLGEETHIVFHSHETAGLSIQQYVAAIEAGVSQVDCSLSPVSGGTCQPDIVTLWAALRGTEYDLGIDVERVREVEQIFSECMSDYFTPPEALGVAPTIHFSPMPGGALTANTQMMRDNGILDRYPEVIAAMREVVAKGGFGTSVTPVSQFYFQQAFNNVMFGPWERMADGYGKMVLGYFGKTPLSPDPEVIARASELLELEPTTEDPIDINDADAAKGIPAARTMLQAAGIEETDENIFVAATCKEKGIQFLKGEARVSVRKSEEKPAAETDIAGGSNESGPLRITVSGNAYTVAFEGDDVLVDGVRYPVSVESASNSGSSQPAAADEKAQRNTGQSAPLTVAAPFAGLVLRVGVEPGATVGKGDTIVVLESMKMETPLASPAAGVIGEIRCAAGDQVASGQVLATVVDR